MRCSAARCAGAGGGDGCGATAGSPRSAVGPRRGTSWPRPRSSETEAMSCARVPARRSRRRASAKAPSSTSASPAKATMPVVGLLTTLSRLTVIDVLSRSVLLLGGDGACGGVTSLAGGLTATFDASGPATSAFGAVGDRICSGTSLLAVSGRLMILGITGSPGAAAGGGTCGGDFMAGAAGVA